MCVQFATTHPDRTRGLVLVGTRARFKLGPMAEHFLALIHTEWGKGTWSALIASLSAPDEQLARWLARVERLTATPRAAAALMEQLLRLDVVPLLGNVRAPTLVVRFEGDLIMTAGAARQLAGGIPGAELVEYPGGGHHPIFCDYDAMHADIERFLARRVLDPPHPPATAR
jgi:pimeloyl-ACP methyl ester carboxylesterase